MLSRYVFFSWPVFFFFTLYVRATRRRYHQLHLLIILFFPSGVANTNFRDFLKICLVHGKKKNGAVGNTSGRLERSRFQVLSSNFEKTGGESAWSSSQANLAGVMTEQESPNTTNQFNNWCRPAQSIGLKRMFRPPLSTINSTLMVRT